MKRNRSHFGQAHGTPFTMPPLSDSIGFTASSNECELILEGNYTNDELDETTQCLIKNLKKCTQLDEIKSELTLEEFQGKIKAWDERTTTSPSGVHLGHLKSYFAPHSLEPGSDEANEWEDNRRMLLKIHLGLLNYALRLRYSFSRWKTIVNSMIEKDPGNPRIHRLRVNTCMKRTTI